MRFHCRSCGDDVPYLLVCRECKVQLCEECMVGHLLHAHREASGNLLLREMTDMRDADSLKADRADEKLHRRQGV